MPFCDYRDVFIGLPPPEVDSELWGRALLISFGGHRHHVDLAKSRTSTKVHLKRG